MKPKHRIIQTTLAMAAGTLMAATANAATVVNIQAETSGGTKIYSGVGAYAGDSGTYWNDASGNGTYSNLKASDGTTLTTITIQKSTGQGVSNGSTGTGTIGLFSGSNNYGNGTGYAFTIGGLNTTKTYDIYLYGYQHSSTYRTLFHIDNGSPENQQTGGNGGAANTFIEGDVVSNATVLDSNYVLFAGVAPNGSGQITGTWGTASGYGILNGFQIVEVIPEPSSGLMMIAGTMLLGLRRRRRA